MAVGIPILGPSNCLSCREARPWEPLPVQNTCMGERCCDSTLVIVLVMNICMDGYLHDSVVQIFFKTATSTKIAYATLWSPTYKEHASLSLCPLKPCFNSMACHHGLRVQAAKLELVEGIRYNSSMAASLCSYHVLNGSWKAILQDLEQVSIQQLQC